MPNKIASPPRVLLTPRAMRDAISDVLSAPGKRIIAVGFVGADPLEWLPIDCAGIEVLCWDKPGATQPQGIDALIEELHAKIYWSEGAGAVIGSSNLSANGLGDNGLLEAGVRVTDNDGDIVLFLTSLFKRAATHGTDEFNERLAILRIRDTELRQRLADLPWHGASAVRTKRTRTFGGWLAMPAPQRQLWQLGYWTTPKHKLGEKTRQALMARHPDGAYENCRCNDTEDLKSQVATLDFKVVGNGRLSKAHGCAPHWWFPETVVVVPSEKPNPFHWFARKNVPTGSTLPFTLDARFKRALEATMIEYRQSRDTLIGPVGGDFLASLEEHYGPQ
jgi:hypothetical protein